MEIYLMRHGDAISTLRHGGSDMDRPLSEIGELLLRKAARYFAKELPAFRAILTSPAWRARQTAHLVAEAFPGVKVEVVSALSSGAKADALKEVVLSNKDRAPFLMVGHNPDLSIFASRVTGIPALMDDASFRAGEMMALESGPLETSWMDGRLLWRRQLPEWDKGD